MGLKARLTRLEGPQGPEDWCPECGGKIIYEEIAEDGTVTYPGGEPCAVCGSAPPWPGAITRIVVDMRDRAGDDDEDDGKAAAWP